MQKYDEYKVSGIEWIGKIPQHWELRRGKFSTSILAGFAFDSDKFDPDEGMPLIRIRDIDKTTTEIFFDGEYPPNYIVNTGDVLIGMDGDFNIAVWKGGRALLNQRVCRVIENNKMLSKYAFYLLGHPLKLINDITYSTTVKHLSTTDLYNYIFPVPPVEEQEAIVEYLDKKCGSIDKVIATQERRIGLLSELKQSIITDAVTRGINPDAPLKDSGIEWISKIPQHWEALKIAHLFSNIGSGTTPNTEISDYYSEVKEHYWLQTGDLNDGYIRDTTKYLSDKAIRRLGLNIYPKGSLVVAMYGATTGKLGLLDIETSVNQACCVLSGSKLLLSKFTFYSFLAAKGYLISLSAGGGQPNISQSTIRNHKTSVPPLSEQEAIVEYLDTKCSSIDAAISKAKREIELLREFKQSVITEAVTGKIKVTE